MLSFVTVNRLISHFLRNMCIMKRVFLILSILCFTCIHYASAQKQKYEFKGKIIDSESKEPLEYVTIQIPKQGLWAVSDKNGSFRILFNKSGIYEYEIQTLGYQKETGKITVDNSQKKLQVFKLHPLSLALSEVVVTAQEHKNGSTSTIAQTAIQHLQPKSVDDLLQLLPGGVTKNPDLNSVGQAYIREISSNSNNALGTSVIVNGAPLSNDANLQTLSTSKSGASLINAQSTSGQGTDLRTISPDNIESIEVIRGIPSVEYGNLTSGAVIIKTKSGVTPLEAKVKLDSYSKMFYAGKGFLLGEKAGAMNFSADYSQSYDDIRMKYKGFDRVTANAGYSNTFMKHSTPLTFNANISFYSNINNEKADPQLKTNERIKNENMGIRFNLEGNWRLDKSWISNLGYSFMTSYSRQKDFQNKYVILQSGVTPISDSYISQEYQSRFQSASYYSPFSVEGIPVDIFAQLKADKLFQISSDCFSRLKVGFDWNYNVNKGNGLVFDPLLPPEVAGNQSVRTRSFKSIPAMNQLSFFLEDRFQIPIKKTILTLQAGMRMTELFVDKAQAGRDNIFMIEPRFNIEYNILNKENNSFFDDLTFSAGFGIASKSPTLLYLYPDKAYFDETSFASVFANDPSKALSVMTTKVIDDTSNPDLKPTINRKFEIGLSGKVRQFMGSLNFFYEKSKNEFGFSSAPVIMPFRRYSISNGAEDFNYENGMLYYIEAGIRQEAGVTNDVSFFTYSRPSNRYQTQKKGLEYSLNFGEIPFIKTSLIVDGAWLYIKRFSTTQSYKTISTSYAGEKYPYMALMPAGMDGAVSTRFNTNFRFITHIPQLKMIFSTTAQVIWKQTEQRLCEDEAGNSLYYKAYDEQAKGERYFVNPLGFIDRSGSYTSWNDSYNADYKYRLMMTQYVHGNYFGKEEFPTTVILNFRLTKEIGKMLELSFMANNFLKIRKTAKRETSTGYTTLTIPMYFGAEMKLKF